MAALGLGCHVQTFPSCAKQGLIFALVQGLIVVASLVGSKGSGAWTWQLWCTGLVAPWHMGSSQIRDGIRVPHIGR